VAFASRARTAAAMTPPRASGISLHSCWAKIERAKEHRDLLDRHLRHAFSVDANRPRLGIKFDADTGRHVLYISDLPDLDHVLRRASVCVGDIMHNFRSALDHLTYQLALWNTGGRVSRPKRAQFPILNQPDHFNSAQGDALREVHPDHQAIIERFQPYHRIPEARGIGPSFHSLAVLRDLDNADKVSLITLVLMPPASLTAYHGAARTLVGLALRHTPHWAVNVPPIAPGSPLVEATLPPHVAVGETEAAGHVTPHLGLPEGWPVDHIIDRVGAVVLRVMGEFQLLV
jgi:hypothetical protein